MAYSLTTNETVPEGIRRIAHEQLDHAIRELTDGGIDRHTGVHQARKRLKKLRALLRLARKSLAGSYGRENAFLRDTARQLSKVRDAEALVESTDALKKRFNSQLPPETYNAVRKALVARRQFISGEQVDLDARVSEVVAELRTAHDRVETWFLKAHGFKAIGPGFRKIYQRGRKAMKQAYAKPTDERFHEWRKRAKDHWYHTRLLKQIWPELMEARQGALKELSDVLGDDHDLVGLRETLIKDLPPTLGKGELNAVVELMAQRQQELRAEAKTLGQRLYADPPGPMRKRVRGYWDAWTAEALAAASG